MQVAANAMGILGDLTEPGEGIPQISIDDIAGRIAAAFPDRIAWNEAVHDSHLEPEQKVWLVVP